MRYILSIDQGTTGNRAIVYDQSGQPVAQAYQEFAQYFPKPGWVEHNPEEIWESVNAVIQKVLSRVNPNLIAAIGITNQRETTVLWDKKTGQPIHHAIVWQCRRTAPRCEILKKIPGFEQLVRKKTGLPIDAYFSATKIEWLLNRIPGAFQKAQKGELLFGTTDSWILWKLTGGQVHATDFTNASRTMLFNINTLAWEEALLKFFKIPKKILPQVLPSSGIFGKTIKIGKLKSGIPIAGIAGDQQAALFGQTCFESGSIKSTYGTGCFILQNVGKKRPSSKHGLIVTLGCDAKGQPVYALEGAIFIAGAALQWLRDGLKIIKHVRETEKMAFSLKSNEGIYFVPALVGLGAPFWDSGARGTIVGITRGTKRAQIVRAALEAMAYSTKDVLCAMQKDTGLKIKNLRVDGGAAANNFLCQFLSDILGQAVLRSKSNELTAQGAAYLAGLAVKFWKNAAEIKKHWQVGRRFTPNLNPKTAAAFYGEWQLAVKRSRLK